MKISKLFHWLYALVMFLPILMFIPNTFYYGFNEHATNNDTYIINYKYQTNEVDSLDDLVPNNLYFFNGSLDTSVDTNLTEKELIIKIVKCDYIILFDGSIDEVYVDDYVSSDDNYITLQFNYDYGYVFLSNNHGYASVDTTRVQIKDFHFYISDDNELDTFKVYYQDNWGNDFSYLSDSDFNLIESVSNSEDTITNKMYQGWQQVWDLPIFSWSHSTYFSAPFTYISGLFGWQVDNSISYCLSYWFTISIIWLVFDVMLYVPLLVHRWLDKASIS